MAGGAYEELSQTGRLGPESFALLRRLVHQVHRKYGFPPPEGHTQWSDDAAYDVITAMLTRPGTGQHFVTACFTQAFDDASLERLFWASVRHFLIDEAKKTPRGKLRRRIARLMGQDETFRKVPGPVPRWALREHPHGTVWQGDVDVLTAYAWQVRGVGITRWNRSGPTPAATVHALMTVLTEVLRYAGAAVREEDLAKVLQSRFELLAPARCVALFADDGSVAGLAAGVLTAADDTGSGRAGEIWRQLTAVERRLLPHLDRDARHAARLLDVGREQAAAVLAGLKDKLRLALADDSEQEAVMAALLSRGAEPLEASQ